jgi:hypothetical protein
MKRMIEVEGAGDIDDSGPGTRTYGGLISCKSEDQLIRLGILHVILVNYQRQCIWHIFPLLPPSLLLPLLIQKLSPTTPYVDHTCTICGAGGNSQKHGCGRG